MGLLPIESNLNFLQLTGQSRKVGAVGTYQPYQGGGVTGAETETSPARAVDRLPKAQILAFNEYLPEQAGYKAGLSTKTLWA